MVVIVLHIKNLLQQKFQRTFKFILSDFIVLSLHKLLNLIQNVVASSRIKSFLRNLEFLQLGKQGHKRIVSRTLIHPDIQNSLQSLETIGKLGHASVMKRVAFGHLILLTEQLSEPA